MKKEIYKKKYSIGDRIKIKICGDKNIYTLFQVAASEICAMSLSSYNRFAEPVKVKDIECISIKEMEQITDKREYYFVGVKK